MFFTGCCGGFSDDFIDVLYARGDHLCLFFGRLNAIADLFVDLLIVQLLERQLQDLTLSVLAVVEEAEEGDALVVLHREARLVHEWIVEAVVEERLDHANKAIEVNTEVVVHLEQHVVLVRHCALVE